MDPNIDYSKLPSNVLELIERVESNKRGAEIPAIQEQIETLKSAANPTMRLQLDNLSQELAPITELVQMIAERETPETPDFSAPIVDALDELGKTWSAAVRGMDIRPQVSVQAPEVNVPAPQVDVDLSAVERVLKYELPKALEQAIKKIPKTEVNVPQTDLSSIEDSLREMLDKLESIDIGTRLKPQFPTTLKVTNPDGSSISTPKTTINGTDVVPIINASPQAMTTGSITTVGNTVTATDLRGVGSVTVSIYGTHTGVNLTFEVYDGVNWIIQAAQALSSANTAAVVATGVIATNATVAYNVSPLLGVQQIRVRCTAITSGSASVIIEPSTQFVPLIQTVNGSVTSAQGTGSATSQWSVAGYSGFLVADIASAAITTTTTSGAIQPGQIGNIGANSQVFHFAVTAFSGTSPTLDIAIEESSDAGTNWNRVYEFPRVTGTGNWTSPRIPNIGGRSYRYVRTVGGTTPSFTMSLNRLMHSVAAPYTRQFFDRTINVNTLNSTTPTYVVAGASSVMATLNMGAITTTAPVITIQGSEDGTNWYPLGTSPSLTGAASSTVVNYIANAAPNFVRGTVTTAGSGATLGYISIKALGA